MYFITPFIIGVCRFTKAAQTCTNIDENGRRFVEILSRIRKLRSRSIALSTCMRHWEIFLEKIASSFVSFPLEDRKAGTFKNTPRGKTSCSRNPLSASIKSPAWNKKIKSFRHTLLRYRSLINVEHEKSYCYYHYDLVFCYRDCSLSGIISLNQATSLQKNSEILKYATS